MRKGYFFIENFQLSSYNINSNYNTVIVQQFYKLSKFYCFQLYLITFKHITQSFQYLYNAPQSSYNNFNLLHEILINILKMQTGSKL